MYAVCMHTPNYHHELNYQTYIYEERKMYNREGVGEENHRCIYCSLNGVVITTLKAIKR